MTLTSTLAATPTKELLRAYNSDKEYLFFDISVFNVGAAISIICTDHYKEINQNTWNGYDFMIENDSTTKFYIFNALKERITEDNHLANPEGHKLTDRQQKRIKSLKL